ncbi:hypothetical protein [Saccharopolyspora taberi]|uniref:Secreted protein n=1 Tax=Saccharopolyspora taberi TaxID=60895 RepID=A0ABN3VGD5_9PSEU
MVGLLWGTVRAGIFLLFVVLLAVVGPQSSAVAGPVAQSAPSTSEEKNEHRESQKHRERLPGITFHRRDFEPAERGHRPLPGSMQHGVADRLRPLAVPPSRNSKPHEKCFRELHSPAALQVFRH